MKRKNASGDTEYSVSSCTVIFESTEKSTSELKVMVDDILSHHAYVAGLSRWSTIVEQEVIGTALIQSRFTVTLVSFKKPF